jgi:hypothetical protein
METVTSSCVLRESVCNRKAEEVRTWHPPPSLRHFFPLPADIGGLLHSVTLLAHLTSDTIAHGSATSLRAPPEPADCKYQGQGGAPKSRVDSL